MIIIGLDCETTGFANRDRIVQVGAAVVTVEGEVLGTFSELCDPGMPIPAAATEVHHITDAMVRGKPKPEDVLTQLIDWLAGLIDGREYALVAHNASFDRRMLTNCLPAGPWDELQCTMQFARGRWKKGDGIENHKLPTVAARVGVGWEAGDSWHDAAADALVVARVAATFTRSAVA